MADIIKKGRHTYWRDAEGMLVPEKYIPLNEKKRDQMVEIVIKKVKLLQKTIKDAKKEIAKIVREYLNQIANEYDENWQGNTKLYNFTRDKEVEVKISKKIAFDEKLQIAKQKIDKCIMKWSQASDKRIVAIVNNAFKVDKTGNVDVKMILSLRKLKINDTDWKQAMDLISDAVIIQFTKRYFNFREKKDEGRFEPIVLNFSHL